jgi:A/G-specific adenine glycosylase
LQGLISSIPGKKPKKIIPVRDTVLFIVFNSAGDVLLEKRPPSGIWGSLYSFPEGNKPTEMPNLSAPVTIQADSLRTLEPQRHTFSHFHLDITPVTVQGEPTNAATEPERWLWYPLDGSVQVGLAAPVKKIIKSLSAT